MQWNHRHPAFRSLAIGLFLALPFCTSAQEYLPPMEEEHRLRYMLREDLAPASWKMLHEMLKGFDPLLRAVHDPIEQTVKILAYRQVSSDEVVELATQLGISLTPASVVEGKADLIHDRK